ncbi:helix-turn-helix transcriptional regulator [Candidatus Beckwithbacteria bacterium]|nr:helix-turn-helix transcriptional regulator [Candidatus Beckwithbacteria bacterium]
MIKNHIKVLRAQRDMTQEQLAEAVGATRQTILAIEKNKYYPTLKLAFAIAQAFGVGIERVFYENQKGEAYEK